MHIGVEATCWGNNRGYGRHARALLSALVRLDAGNDYTLFLDSAENAETVPPGVKVRMVASSRPAAVAAAANGRRSLRDLWRMSRALAARDLDLLLFPTVYSFVPVWSRARKVIVVHDVIIERFPQLTLPRRASRWFWKVKAALGRWQASALVTVSEHSRQGIVEHFGVKPERVFVVGEASDPVFQVLDAPRLTARLESLGIPRNRPLVVYVGGFGPHKNLETLVEAFACLSGRNGSRDARLILVGEYVKEVFHSSFAAVKSQVQRLGLSERTVFTGYLPDDELVMLLNLATVLVLPSLLEGFGLPAVEAAACGLPVIATTASPLPGLLGEGGLYVDPHDREGWQRAT